MNSYKSPDLFTIELLSKVTPPEDKQEQKQMLGYILDKIKPEYTSEVESKHRSAYASIMCSDHYGSVEDLKLMQSYALTAITALKAADKKPAPKKGNYLDWSTVGLEFNTLLKVKVFTGRSKVTRYIMCQIEPDQELPQLVHYPPKVWDYHNPEGSDTQWTKQQEDLIEDLAPYTIENLHVLDRRPVLFKHKVVD